MGHVNVFGGSIRSVKDRLPSGYSELEYIQSSGTQYIDTGFKPSYNSRVVVGVSNLTTEDFVFGARDTSSSSAAKQFGVYISSASKIRSDYFGTNVTGTPSSIDARTTIDKNANVTTAFGLTLTNTSKTSGQVSRTMYLFALNNVGTITAAASMKLYSCLIFDNGQLVRNFVPCKSSDGVVGLYDLVEKKFYANKGTGVFTGGAPIGDSNESGEQKDYTELAYIQNNSTSAYIDTDFKPSNNTRVVMEVACGEYLNIGDQAMWFFYSCGDYEVNNNFGASVLNLSPSDPNYDWIYFAYGYGDEPVDHNGVRSKFSIDHNKNKVTLSGNLSYTLEQSTFSCSDSLTLFAHNGDDAITTSTGIIKMYSCKIYDNGTLVRDFIPCLWKTGEAGMYDKVNSKFYGSSGSGSFGGSEV